ncbi:MAG: DNA polymerase/3'-5' exonuclease PolX [Bacteroidetes bacterium B1(2017)]|nr:MAG: DNA polymerase/3'-5' exonuclease PolX [Bacteroidetes bacterium B1(2017)]
MTNSDLADIFKLYADLSELHGGNPFKIKTFASASFRIDKIIEPLFGKSVEELEKMEGIGKSIAQKIYEITSTNTFQELTELMEATPSGVRDIMRIKGIGPKKVAVIWKEMGVESIGELLYACKENRLAQYKGFGLKTQEAVIKQIEFMFVSADKFHYAKAYPVAQRLLAHIEQFETVESVELIGEIKRKFEVLTEIEILICTEDEASFRDECLSGNELDLDEEELKFEGYKIKIEICHPSERAYKAWQLSSSATHIEKVVALFKSSQTTFDNEEEIYTQAGLPFIVAELREDRGEIEKAQQGKLPTLIEFKDLTGPLHNHSTWSDGIHTIETMANFCLDKGYAYLGMADHSKSAFYANGLSEEKVLKQQEEIRALNQKFAGKFKVFAGIESDILYDGNLDYEEELLKTFDYVVASVHSVLKMNEEKAMSRLITAIENKYTTILGHPTGRLLLMREGYPINHEKIIDACAANGVIIELNANPYRLDMDWRHLDYALNKGVMISINPDAHEVDGFYDMFWGVEVARKGGLSKEMCFNAQDLSFIEAHFAKKRA